MIESLGSGGAERQMTMLSSLLLKEDYDVRVWTYYPDAFYLPFLNEKGVPYECVQIAQPRYKRLFVLREKLKRENPDAVIAYLDSATSVMCLVKLLGADFRLVVSERNTTQKLTVRERLKFFFYRWADVVVPNSATQTAFIAWRYPELKPKLTTIHNYIDVNRFVPADESETCQKRFSLLVVARINRQKNVLRFLQTLYEIKKTGSSLRVAWVGGSSDNLYQQEVMNLYESLQLQDVLQFFPPQQDVLPFYQQAEAFCLPSLYEGFPNVIGEAMCCGLPVLCGDVCDNPVLVQEGENGMLFDPCSVNSMVKTLRLWQELPADEKKKMGEKSRKKALELFSAESFVSSYEKCLER